MKHNSKEMRKTFLWEKKKKRYFSKRYRPARAKKLVIGLNLKPGDIIHTCLGFNQVIKSIAAEAGKWTGKYGQEVTCNLWDFDIVTEDGSSHSWMHCSGPKASKEEIEDAWFYSFRHPSDDSGRSLFMQSSERMRNASLWMKERYESGLPICDDNGLMLPEYMQIMGYRLPESKKEQ